MPVEITDAQGLKRGDRVRLSRAATNSLPCALAQLWSERIHPFEDGNGRGGRAVVDLILACDAGEPSRLPRISQQMLAVTRWVVWFTDPVRAACVTTPAVIDLSLGKALFWAEHRAKDLSPRGKQGPGAGRGMSCRSTAAGRTGPGLKQRKCATFNP